MERDLCVLAATAQISRDTGVTVECEDSLQGVLYDRDMGPPEGRCPDWGSCHLALLI